MAVRTKWQLGDHRDSFWQGSPIPVLYPCTTGLTSLKEVCVCVPVCDRVGRGNGREGREGVEDTKQGEAETVPLKPVRS